MRDGNIGGEATMVIEHGASVFFLPAEPTGRENIHASKGGDWADLQMRLGALLRGEMTSFLQAKQYLQIARRYVTAARKARTCNAMQFAAHLEAANSAHRRARKCLSYARLCRERARTLGEDCGTSIAS
ncbi:MAG: hypothetical protein HWD60_04140 [Defluviicoccus sp.]|nr:MAG: hypothetical protein HWD60_04140 [Defluviicoccus sp.]